MSFTYYLDVGIFNIPFLMFLLQRTALDDEGPVRQLCGPKDDRCIRADAAKDADATD